MQYGQELYQAGQLEQALPVARELCGLVRQSVGEHHADFAAALNRLAILYQRMGDHAAALPLFRQALEVSRAALGEANPRYADSLTNLAGILCQVGDYSAAEPLCSQALGIYRAALGPQHPRYVDGLNNLARVHVNTGNYPAAEPLFREVIEICRAVLGEQDPNFAAALGNLAGLYQDRGDFSAAEPLYRQARDVYHTALGERHPAFAATLDSLAMLAYERGDLAESEALYRQVLEIRRTTLGERHPDFPESLGNLAGILQVRGEYAAAEAAYREVLAIYRDVWDNRHPNYHVSLNNLALLHVETRNYAAARPLLEQVLETVRATRGEQDPDYAVRLKNLAEVCKNLGDYAAVEPMLRQAGEVFRAKVGERHPNSLDCLHSLANLYHVMGDHAAAVSLHQQVLELRRAAEGERHPHFAVCLNDLALVCNDTGDYAAAESYSRQALEAWRRAVGVRHSKYALSLITRAMIVREIGDHSAAESLSHQALEIIQAIRGGTGAHDLDSAYALVSLASTYARRRDFAAAEPLCRQAAEAFRAAFGERHPLHLTALSNLASLYWQRGDYAAAEPLHRQVLDTRRAVLGERHPDTAASLNNLAAVCSSLGRYETAESLYRQALEVIRPTLGECHRHFVSTLYNLANALVAVGREGEALELMRQAGTTQTRLIGQVFGFASERQRMAFLREVLPDYAAFLSLLRGHFAGVPEIVLLGLELVLCRKALGAEALATQLDAVLGGRYPAQEARLRELAVLRQQIARNLLAGPGAEGAPARRLQIDRWITSKERLEAELARHIPEMDLHQRLSYSSPQAVVLNLPESTALVEFVVYLDLNLHSIRYLAFILLAGGPAGAQLIDLGPTATIDRLITDFRAGITGRAEFGEGGDEPHPGVAPPGESAGNRLRAALFDPLTNALKGRKWLLLAPDGDLNLLPFGVLPLPDGRFLLDEYRISYVGVGRDVLRFQNPSGRQPGEPLVVADPDFDLVVRADAAAEPARLGRLAANRTSRDLGRGRYHFPRLPGTRVEGERVGARVGVRPLLRGEALEGQLKGCHSPRILHLATHGFFLPNPRPELSHPFGRNLELGFASDPAGLGPLSGLGMENPMLRSGLALAGANTFLRGGALPDEAQDGILTAEDVAGLDLLDTELVVLSACETGLGQVQVGEGVFGLRRAFIVAGAKTLVMSLWRVPDLATAFLMDRLYDNLLARGVDRDLALRDAQRATRDVTVGELRAEWLSGTMIERLAAGDAEARRALEELARQPDGHRPFAHPFYWGAFICQGGTAPLPAVDEGSV
jgi:tetratricopeptide (TPR) repeat protein/CHAT domain-containing protein